MKELNPFEQTELSARQRDIDYMGTISDVNTSFCTLVPETVEDKKKMYNIISNTQENLADHVNEEISVIGIYGENVTVVDEKTGEDMVVPRIVLIDEDMVGYGCASFGVYNSLKKLMKIFGVPSKDEPYRIKIKQRKLKNNYTALVLELI